MECLLRMEHIEKSFPGVRALKDVSLEIRPGEVHALIGEKQSENMLLIEVMTIGEDFTLNFMQSGRGDRYVNAFVDQLRTFGIPVSVIGETRYTLCDTTLPE